jgi:hypothetical protein
MANTITLTTVFDGRRTVIAKVDIIGDSSGEETATQILDISALSPAPTSVGITRIQSSLENFNATILFDGTADVVAWHCSSGTSDVDFRDYPIQDTSTGATSDLLLTTLGLGTERGSLLIHCVKAGTTSIVDA